MNCYDDDNVTTLLAMRRQEELTYKCKNCYHLVQSPLTPPGVAPSCTPNEPVTPQTRNVLCDWANKIIDFCNLDRETVEIAMSYVDRYVQTEIGREILLHSDKYQLLVVTSLYVAIKVTETVAISSSQFEKISRNTFTAKDVESMERMLLSGLKWNLHPPTSLSFIRLYLNLIPSATMDQDAKETAFILAKLQTELAVRDCALVAVRASTIAFAALMNSFDALGLTETASGSFTVHCFVSKVASCSLAHKAAVYDEGVICPIQNRLYQAIAKQTNVGMEFAPPSAPMTPKQSKPTNNACEHTPRSIIGRAV